MKTKIIKQTILFWLLIGLLSACREPITVNGITGSVISVENGNTIVLSNGLTVRLIGIKDTPGARNYLDAYLKGKTVILRVNNDDEQYIYGYDSEVYAYVNTPNLAVNGDMLRKRFTGLDFSYLTDSIDAYKSYSQAVEDIELSFEQLFTKFAPATFSIVTDKGFGTGFFINEDGLALSNAHVLNSKSNLSDIRCYLWDSDGEVTSHRFRTIHRIVQEKYKGQTGNDDWVIFYVTKDGENEKFPFYNLNRQRIRQGQRIGVLGTPQGKNGNLTEGTISNIEGNIITISADINKGNSGGPVFNTTGAVVGIATWVDFQDMSKINLAFDIQPIREALDKMGDIYYGGK